MNDSANETELMTAETPRSMAVTSPLDLPVTQFREGLARRKENRQSLLEWIRSALVEGTDYGRIQIKGRMSKPSLFKPGAEKICGMLGVTVMFPTIPEYEARAISGQSIESIILRCEICDGSGRIVGHGLGARSVSQDNGDLNKALKMAEKSAQIDATLRMAGLSELFTQDLEDIRSLDTKHDSPELIRPAPKPAPPTTVQSPAPKPAPKPPQPPQPRRTKRGSGRLRNCKRNGPKRNSNVGSKRLSRSQWRSGH